MWREWWRWRAGFEVFDLGALRDAAVDAGVLDAGGGAKLVALLLYLHGQLPRWRHHQHYGAVARLCASTPHRPFNHAQLLMSVHTAAVGARRPASAPASTETICLEADTALPACSCRSVSTSDMHSILAAGAGPCAWNGLELGAGGRGGGLRGGAHRGRAAH